MNAALHAACRTCLFKTAGQPVEVSAIEPAQVARRANDGADRRNPGCPFNAGGAGCRIATAYLFLLPASHAGVSPAMPLPQGWRNHSPIIVAISRPPPALPIASAAHDLTSRPAVDQREQQAGKVAVGVSAGAALVSNRHAPPRQTPRIPLMIGGRARWGRHRGTPRTASSASVVPPAWQTARSLPTRPPCRR